MKYTTKRGNGNISFGKPDYGRWTFGITARKGTQMTEYNSWLRPTGKGYKYIQFSFNIPVFTLYIKIPVELFNNRETKIK